MMDDGHGSKRKKKKKKKRGKSLIFKNFFKPAGSGDEHEASSASGRKALASDDNLVYCDVSGNCVDDPDIKKPSSSRMSRIFKAVLFDSALKKKKHGNDSSETPLESGNTSPIRDDKIEKFEPIEKIKPIEKTEKIGNSINEEKSDNKRDPDVDHTSSDRSINQIPLPSKPVESSASSSSITTASQTLTERKVTPVEKKPPLPSNPRPAAKPNPVEESKHVASNDTTVNLRLYILLGVLVFVVMVLWKIFAAISGFFSSDNTKSDVAGDEL